MVKTKVFQLRSPGLLRVVNVIEDRQVAFLLKQVGLLQLLYKMLSERPFLGWSPQGHREGKGSHRSGEGRNANPSTGETSRHVQPRLSNGQQDLDTPGLCTIVEKEFGHNIHLHCMHIACV